ncbi:14-3-3 protein 9 [Tanacetum coccineum]
MSPGGNLLAKRALVIWFLPCLILKIAREVVRMMYRHHESWWQSFGCFNHFNRFKDLRDRDFSIILFSLPSEEHAHLRHHLSKISHRFQNLPSACVLTIVKRAQGIAALPSRWHALASCENDMEAMSYAPLPSNAQLTSYLSSYHRRQSFRKKGDYYRYFAEFKSGNVKKEAANSLLVAFQLASTTTEADLSPTHHIRLGLTLNFFVFCYKNMNPPERAYALLESLRDQKLKKFLWLLFSKHFDIIAGRANGSVIGSNCKVLAGQPDIDGFLVAVEVESAKHLWDQLAGPSQSTCAQVIHARPNKVNTIEHNAGEDDNMDGIAMGKDLEIGVHRNSDKGEMLLDSRIFQPSRGDFLRKQQKEMLLKVWRGKWGPLVAESGEWKMKKRLNH